MKRRSVNVFSLSFLDAMTCGFGAVILFFMVINSAVGESTGRMTGELRSEVDRLDQEVLDGIKNLVELRNSLEEVDQQNVVAHGLSRRILEQLKILREELATYDASTMASREHVNRLKSDLKTLEEDTKRLSAAAPSEEIPGDKLRTFVGDGDRQYLTGLKVGGERIFILVDASASMLDQTIVNIVRRRNLPAHQKRRSEKWQQAVRTVDWLTTQLPRQCLFQIYTFNELATPLTKDTKGQWLDGGDREVLDQAVANLRSTVPERGTNLYQAFRALKEMSPPPDNLILLTDGLPTMGRDRSRSAVVSPKERQKLFKKAVEAGLPRLMPVNVILFPMEGDPMAASLYWRLALGTGGSYMNPSKDWP